MAKHKTVAEEKIAVRVGARIRQVREMQHISQLNLAKDIGIRAGPLGWIEKGKHLPSGRVLYRLAKQLNIRMDDLFQDADVWQSPATPSSDSAPVVLGPMDLAAGTPSEDVKATHIICKLLADNWLKLEEMSGVSKKSQLPLICNFASTEAGALYLATLVRGYMQIGERLVSDYLEILEDAGIRVVFVEMPQGCDSFGGYDPLNENAFIFVNSLLKKQPEQQVYRLILELGRVYWHARKVNNFLVDQASGSEVALDEAAFVKRFVQHFMMPSQAIQTLMIRLNTKVNQISFDLFLHLKRRFGVSAQALSKRLAEFGVYTSEKQQKRCLTQGLFKDEMDAWLKANPNEDEPGGKRPQLTVNERLFSVILCAQARISVKEKKELNAIKRVFRQSGVKLELYD